MGNHCVEEIRLVNERQHRHRWRYSPEGLRRIRLSQPNKITASHRQRFTSDLELRVLIDEKRNACLLELPRDQPWVGVPTIVISHHRENAMSGFQIFQMLQQRRNDARISAQVISREEDQIQLLTVDCRNRLRDQPGIVTRTEMEIAQQTDAQSLESRWEQSAQYGLSGYGKPGRFQPESFQQ